MLTFPKSYEQRISSALEDHSKGDSSSALNKLLKMIDDGLDEANLYVGAFYEYGCEGVDKDYSKALFYYEKATEKTGDVEAYLALGRMYYYGMGVDTDVCKAKEYCEKVANEANHTGVAELMLGKIYQDGQCVKKDLQKAKEYYKSAISQGYLMGYTHLGSLEIEAGNYIRGWLFRAKAAMLFITSNDAGQWKIRDF